MNDPTDAPPIIKVNDDLVIEMVPGGGIDKPVLIIRNTETESDGEDSRVVVFLEEARALIDALVEAAAWLAVRQVGQSPPELRQTDREESHD